MKVYLKLFSLLLVLIFSLSGTSVFEVSAESTYTQPEKLIYGDVDMDGTLTIKDATLIQKYIAELEDLSLLQKQAAKIKDSKITIRNATDVQKHIAGIEVNNSKVGKTEFITEPDTFRENLGLETASTGDEIAFTQTEYVVWNTRCESWEYFANYRFHVFDKNHYILNDLDGTKLENKYTDKYFEDKALIVMSRCGSSSYMYRIDSITKSDGVLGVNYTLLVPKSGTVDAIVVNSRLYIEVAKADIEGITDIVVYNKVERY